jgi:hypothetical protein
LHGITRCRRDLELNGSLRLVLDYDGPRGDLVAVADVADPERHEVASAKLAVDAQVEERELAYSTLHLKTNSKGPYVLELERSLLTDELALVPRLAMGGIPMMFSHRVEGPQRCASAMRSHAFVQSDRRPA